MKNILKRLGVIEKAVGGSCAIPERERVIAIEYPDGDEEEYERLKAERIGELKVKYGPRISEDDLRIVGVRKFFKEGSENENQ